MWGIFATLLALSPKDESQSRVETGRSPSEQDVVSPHQPEKRNRKVKSESKVCVNGNDKITIVSAGRQIRLGVTARGAMVGR